jgi:glyceraldehyde-3-phosphate dehydrogenase (NADP+)
MPYEFPIYINGKFRNTKEVHKIQSPFDGHDVGQTFRAGPAEIEETIVAAVAGYQLTRKMAVYERAAKLAIITEDIRQNSEEFAQIICEESAKPIKTARAEVQRAIHTFTDAVEECKRIRGEYMPLDLEPGSKGRWALNRRFPLGPIVGISPFNFPLNLVAHKVAPALATGNSLILKPASQTPLTALRLAQSVAKADWPAGGFNVIPIDSKNAYLLVEDERIKMITFTGSPEIGWELKGRAGRKHITLELGGNAAVILHHDTDLNYAVERCVSGSFGYAGQSCISVQRIYVHSEIYDKFMNLFLTKTGQLIVGDPAKPETDVGPMIHPIELNRVMSWIDKAVKSGASIETGGKSNGNFLEPTVITNVDPAQEINCQEAFAPVVVVAPYTDITEAIREVNNSDFGLQAGLFTRDAQIIFNAYEELDVGGLLIGEVPTYRIDHMPYGGTKMSGMGREGVRFAIESMTETKLLVMNVQ